MINALIAGIGGFIGTILRYLLSTWIYRVMEYPSFPYGTLAVNVLGCLVIGCLGGLAESRQLLTPELRVFIFIGILGGFTTFSSFGFETFYLIRNGSFLLGSINIAAQLFLGLGAVYLGYSLRKLF